MARNTNRNNVEPKSPLISLVVMIMFRVLSAHYTIKGLGRRELPITNSVVNSITRFCLFGIPFSISIYTTPVCNFTLITLLIAHTGGTSVTIIPVFYLILATFFLTFFSTAVLAIPFSTERLVFFRARFNIPAPLTNGAMAVLGG